jgi:ribonucleoside-diphosphate reductase alpha chain
MKTIADKITSVSVVIASPDPAPQIVAAEKLERPAVLPGATYKIVTPMSDYALYVTINDWEFNGQLRPYELFINSKNMNDFQWVVAFTRIVSAVLRTGGEFLFLVEELKSVVNPNGGYWKKVGNKGVWMPSLVAEIGEVFEEHLRQRGLLAPKPVVVVETCVTNDQPRGTQCPSCGAFALIKTEGCDQCLDCGYSCCG